MKNGFSYKTSKRSGPKFSQKRTRAGASGIPDGFHPLSKSMAGVLVDMQKKFVNLPAWYRGDRLRELTAEYYQTLRRVLRESLPSQRLLICCCHCGIFF